MRRLLAATYVVALLSSACSGSGGAATTSDELPAVPVVTSVVGRERFDQFAAQMEYLREQLRIPGMSVALVQDQELVWAEGFGYADLEGEVPATADTSYHLASVTKPVAATVLMQLVEGGELALDHTVGRYGVDLDRAGEIEVQHLLTHTSAGVPGEVHSYDGNRYGELGKVIEAVTGQTFRTVMYERLIAPLGLTHTTGNIPACDEVVPEEVSAAEAIVRRDMARPYQLDHDYEVVESDYPMAYNPAAGLISSVVDLAAFDIALDQGLLLGEPAKAEMLTPVVSTFRDNSELQYGLGWYVQDFEGTRIEWHAGRWPPSVSALYMRVPDHGLTFIVLANTPNLSTPFPLGDGDALTSTLALAFYREFVFPRLYDTSLPIIDWEAGEAELVAQLGEITDEDIRRIVRRELWSYRRLFYSVGRLDVVTRLQHVRDAVFSEAVELSTYLASAADEPPEPSVEVDAADLEPLVGTYVLDADASEWPADLGEDPPASVRVWLEAGRLVSCAPNGPPTILTPVGPARFRSAEGLDIEGQLVGGKVQSVTARLSDDVTLVYLPAGG
jgi:CubicO group peptidase (beta-lactamase class C family)